MNILVTGARGLLAGALIPHLEKHSKVITAGRVGCDVQWDFSLSTPLTGGVPPCDALIHTAGSFFEKTSFDQLQTLATNTLGALHACLLAKEAGCKSMIHISTVYVQPHLMELQPTLYALSKKQAEEIATRFCSLNNIRLLIIRPGQMYGPSLKYRGHQPFFFHMLDRALARENITLYGTRNPARNFIHVDDVAQSIDKALIKHLTGIYSCTAPAHTSYAEIARTAYDLQSANCEVLFNKRQPDLPDIVPKLSNSLFEEIGRFPQISLKAGIHELLELLKPAEKVTS